MKKIDLYLLTGYLGAGKTTFLKSIIKKHPDKKIGIIMNEFGKVGIDGTLVKDGANSLIELNRGSIFCSCLKLSFVESLKEMSEKPIDALFVEGSGLADPSNISEILQATQILIGDKYNYAGSICVVDSKNFEEQYDIHETLKKQIIHSHLAVVTKTDLADNFDIIQGKIMKVNDNIDIVKASHGDLKINFFEDWKKDIQIIEDETSNTVDNKPKTISLESYEAVDSENLYAFLSELSSDAYRIKGFITNLQGQKMQIDVVNGTIDAIPSSQDHPDQLVIISKIGPQIIKKIIPSWESHVKTKYKLKN